MEEPTPAPKRRRKRWMLRLLVYLSLFYTVWLVALYVFQERLIFPGAYLRHDPVEPPPPDAVVLRVETAPQQFTEAWLLPGHGTGPRPLIVFLHGNGERIEDWPWAVRPYRDAGFSVLLVEYRGFGGSDGQPSERACVSDTLALLEQAVAQESVRDAVVLHGRSLGGAVAGLVAGQRPPRGLILESAPASVSRMTARYLAPSVLLRHPFRALEALRGLQVPALVIQGRSDEMIPGSQARLLHEALPNSELVWYDAHHNNLPQPDDYADYWQRVLTVAREAVAE